MSTYHSPNRPKRVALLACASIATIAVVIGAVVGVRAVTADDDTRPRGNLVDLSVKPDDPRWYFDADPRARAEPIGGNAQLVAIASRDVLAGGSTVAFVDTDTGEARSTTESPEEDGRFALCAIVDSGLSAACIIERGPLDDELLVFIDVSSGAIHHTVETEDRRIFAYQNRFFAVTPLREDRTPIDVYDSDGSQDGTIPGGDVHLGSGFVTSIEGDHESDTRTFVVHDLGSLTQVLRYEFERGDEPGFSPFDDGFAIDTERGVAYFSTGGTPLTVVRGARIAGSARGLDRYDPLRPTNETRLPVLADIDDLFATDTLYVASPLTGKPLWRWSFTDPSVASAAGDTVTIRQDGVDTSNVYDIFTGKVLAAHREHAQSLGSDGRHVLITERADDGVYGYRLQAVTGDKKLWETGPYLSEPVVIGGKVYADNQRIF